MPNLRGPVYTESILQSLRKVDLSGIFLLEPTQNPFTLIVSEMGKEETKNPEFKVVEDEYFDRQDRINNGGGYTDHATSVVVDAADKFQVGDVTLVTRTLERIYVGAVTLTTQTLSSLTRGFEGSTPAALQDNDELINLGSARNENATSRQAMITKKTEKTNNTQIISRSIEFSRTQMKSAEFGQNRVDFERRKIAEEVARDIEYAFMFGKKSKTVDATTGEVIRTTGGLLENITENEADLGGASLEEADFEAILRDVFQYGSRKKLAIGSPLFNSIISGYSKNKLQTRQGESTYGIHITDYTSPHGELSILEHRMLYGDVFGAWCWILDIENLKYRYLTDSDVQMNLGIQPNDQDGQKDEILAEVGIEVRHDKTHAFIHDFVV